MGCFALLRRIVCRCQCARPDSLYFVSRTATETALRHPQTNISHHSHNHHHPQTQHTHRNPLQHRKSLNPSSTPHIHICAHTNSSTNTNPYLQSNFTTVTTHPLMQGPALLREGLVPTFGSVFRVAQKEAIAVDLEVP